MLSHPNIEIMLGTEFRDIRDLCSDQCNIFYSGSLDELFDYRFGMLGWRSLRFEWKNIDIPDYQGTAVINYASEDIPCTRVHEFKHLHPEKTAINQTLSTTVCFEYPDSYTPEQRVAPDFIIHEQEIFQGESLGLRILAQV